MSLPFTTALSSAIGRIRVRTGLADPASPDRVEDARVQEFITNSASEYDAALMLLDATIAALARQIKVTTVPGSPDIVQVADAQARFDAFQVVRRNLLTTVPTTTGLPKRSFSALGNHPSDSRTDWGR